MKWINAKDDKPFISKELIAVFRECETFDLFRIVVGDKTILVSERELHELYYKIKRFL